MVAKDRIPHYYYYLHIDLLLRDLVSNPLKSISIVFVIIIIIWCFSCVKMVIKSAARVCARIVSSPPPISSSI